jgi:valyl-tRNA synthetase
LARTSHTAEQHFANYRFDLLSQTLYEFAWNQFCDWFVELAKPALNGDDAAAADSTRHTLLYVLESLLRLLHPLIPLVTEELWRSVAPKLAIDGETISLQEYPTMFVKEYLSDEYERVEADVEWLKAMVSALRRIRSELGVSPAKQVVLLLQGGTANDAARVERFASQLKFLNRIERIDTVAGEPPPAATGIVGDLKLLVPLAGLVDLDAERARLDKELKRVEGELAKSKGKLASETFVQNAPAAVVEQERQRLVDWSAQREALATQRAKL